MTRLPRLTAEEAEKMLLDAGFQQVRSKGSHRIYQRKAEERFVLAFHKGKILQPKIVKALFAIIESESANDCRLSAVVALANNPAFALLNKSQ